MHMNELPAEAEDDEASVPRPEPWKQVTLETEILAVLARAPEMNETIASAFARKEHDLRALFARLSVADARELESRFRRVRPDDLIAGRFAGLMYLNDARRRAALRGETR